MRRICWGSSGPSTPSRSKALPALLLHEAKPLRAAPPPASGSVTAPVLLLIPAHASRLGEAFKLAFGTETTVWIVMFAFKFLEFYAFPPYLLVFYAGRARPRAYLTQH